MAWGDCLPGDLGGELPSPCTAGSGGAFWGLSAGRWQREVEQGEGKLVGQGCRESARSLVYL